MPDAPPLVIRDARPDEMEKVSEVIRAAYAEYEAGMPDGRWERYMHHAAELWSQPDAPDLLVAEVEGRPVGAVTYFPKGAATGGGGWPTDWAGIRLLGVHPQARGLGIGRALVEACIARARAQGAV